MKKELTKAIYYRCFIFEEKLHFLKPYFSGDLYYYPAFNCHCISIGYSDYHELRVELLKSNIFPDELFTCIQKFEEI